MKKAPALDRYFRGGKLLSDDDTIGLYSSNRQPILLDTITTTTTMGPSPHDDSSTASSDFFSPISISFFNKQRQKASSASSAERLPPLHDSSWIGARLSPIGSFDRETHSEDDDDDDEERQDANKENRRNKSAAALHLLRVGGSNNEGVSARSTNDTTSSTLSTAHFVLLANEQTSLLGNRSNSIPLTRNQGSNGSNSQFNSNLTTISANHHSKIHPLWNSPPSNNTMANNHSNEPRGRDAAALAARVRHRLRPYCTLGMFLSVLSGLHLFAMGGYDLWGWYYHGQERETAWMLPWGIPPQSTLLRFGVLAPNNYYYGSTSTASSQPFYVYYFYRYLGVVTSLVVCTSVAEWLLVAAAWRLLHISSHIRKKYPSWHEFGAMFMASAWTGQLWMFAFDSTNNLVIGTVAMGT